MFFPYRSLAAISAGLISLGFAAEMPKGTPSPGTAPVAGPQILTPASPKTPLIHGPKIYGIYPGSNFLYAIPATGERPMTFSIEGAPPEFKLDAATGIITGKAPQTGEYKIVLRAKNSLGETARPFTVRVGETIGLTPAMGWNTYNCFGTKINQSQVLQSAQAMVASGLSQHGWSYICIDDGYQAAERSADLKAIGSDPKQFPDMKALADQVHGLGLKFGIYSTPWTTSYANKLGGSSEDADGKWSPPTEKGKKNQKILPFAIGKYHFTKQDAQQFAAWGVDYLKYDWGPIELPETVEMEEALRGTGRNIIYSLSNNAARNLIKEIPEVSKHANSWRISGDINDQWKSVLGCGFNQGAWARYASPGHFNDPDMMVVGVVGWGRLHPTHLTTDEQYSHVSLWCLLSAPLLLGCDLSKLDPFTLSLLTNDEVLDLDQDSLGRQATQIFSTAREEGDLHIYAKQLSDGSWAAGLFNLGESPAKITLKWSDLGVSGKQSVRDIWRQKNLGMYDNAFTSEMIAPHGVVLIRMTPDPL